MKKRSWKRSVMGRLGYAAAVVLCLATSPSAAIGQERGLGPGGAVSETEPYVAQGSDNAPFACTCTKIEIKIKEQDVVTTPFAIDEVRDGTLKWWINGDPNAKLCVEVWTEPTPEKTPHRLDSATFQWQHRSGEPFRQSDRFTTNCADGERKFKIKGGPEVSPTALGSKMIVKIYHGPCPPPYPRPASICPEEDIRFTVLKVELEELTFADNTAFKADDGITISTGDQKWTPTAKKSALFTQKNKKAKTNAKLKITPQLTSALSMTISGTADSGVTFTKAFDFPAGTTTYTVNDIEASAAYDANFDFIGEIDWKITCAGCQQDLAKTDNNIYYVPDGIQAQWHYDTILYNVCKPMDGNPPANNDTTLNTIWNEFTDLIVYRFDRTTKMRYWALATDGDRYTELALIGGNGAGGYSGNCEGWSRFLKACLELGGKSTSGSVITLVNADRPWYDLNENDYSVVVNNLNVNPTGVDYGHGDYKWKVGSSANPGRWQTSGSMAGQGTPDVPIQQSWPCHKVLELGGKFLDPSYGKKADTCVALENVILGGVEKEFSDPLPYFKPNTTTAAELKEW